MRQHHMTSAAAVAGLMLATSVAAAQTPVVTAAAPVASTAQDRQ